MITDFHRVPKRLGILALRGLSERWKLPQTSWPALLSCSQTTVYEWIKETDGADVKAEAPLTADVAERLSHLVSIYNGLHILFGDTPFADEWVRMPNRAFGGVEPIALIRTGRFDDILRVRRYIDRSNAQ